MRLYGFKLYLFMILKITDLCLLKLFRTLAGKHMAGTFQRQTL